MTYPGYTVYFVGTDAVFAVGQHPPLRRAVPHSGSSSRKGMNSRARAQGKTLGRPKSAVRPERVLAMRAKGLSLRAIAAETGVSVMTAQRIVDAA
jgi:DNA-binding NarL/FixJ family response regulator